MSIGEKNKTVNNKFEQNKAQYSLDRQTVKISALSSGNVSKYEFLTGEDVLPEKDLLEKAATMKRCEYSPLGNELKKQAGVTETQYQSFDSVFNHHEKEEPVTIKKEEPVTIKKEEPLKTDKSSLVYDRK